MSDHRLLHQRKTSFWEANKKSLIIFVSLAVIVMGAGFYLMYYQATPSKEDLSKLPPPQLVPESWLLKYFNTTDINDPKVGGLFGDPDGDKLNNYQEYLHGTDPTKADTDGDGWNDGTEVAYGSDPTNRGISVNQQKLEMDLKKSGVDIDRDEIDKEFGNYLNPDRKPDVRKIEKKDLKVISDSQEAAIEYYKKFQEIKAFTELPYTYSFAEDLFVNSNKTDVDNFVDKQSKVVDGLIALPVPEGLVNVHLTYIKMYDGFLSMGKFAKSLYDQGKAPEHGNFYPELKIMTALDPDLQQYKLDAFYKYQIPI